MLAPLKKSCVEAAIKETPIAEWGLLTQYNMIKGRLADCLEKEQLRCIPDVEMGSYRDTLLELSSASGIAIAFLRSLDSSPEKELEAREQELARGQKEVESMKKLLKESLEAVKEIPEVLRSKAVAEWKT